MCFLQSTLRAEVTFIPSGWGFECSAHRSGRSGRQSQALGRRGAGTKLMRPFPGLQTRQPRPRQAATRLSHSAVVRAPAAAWGAFSVCVLDSLHLRQVEGLFLSGFGGGELGMEPWFQRGLGAPSVLMRQPGEGAHTSHPRCLTLCVLPGTERQCDLPTLPACISGRSEWLGQQSRQTNSSSFNFPTLSLWGEHFCFL